jgi:S-adenosylmethionine:tRNA ribosyltransferase-isomerase
MPLPPYIRRDQSRTTPADEAEDNTRYQTVYAQPAEIAPPRSAAAPTAGLHFTPEVLAALRARRVEIASLTLHVGLGTFQPVRVAELQHIRLHSERYTLPPETAAALNRALAEGRRILAVGTTTTRTLEHIAQQSRSVPNTPQQPSSTTADEPLPHFTPHSGETSIFLAPGHRFRAISGLLTNFHLPESTLIMLVAALAANTPQPHAPGVSTRHLTLTDPDLARRHVLAAYTHAIAHRYRFFSYGDCMLLL